MGNHTFVGYIYGLTSVISIAQYYSRTSLLLEALPLLVLAILSIFMVLHQYTL